MKDLLKRLLVEEEGQGITEYALILGLVVFGIWVAVRGTGIGPAVKALFDDVVTQVKDCNAGGCEDGGGAPPQ